MIVAKTVNGFTLLQPVYRIERAENTHGLQHFSANSKQNGSSFETQFKKFVTPLSSKDDAGSTGVEDCVNPSSCYNQHATEIYFFMQNKTDYRC